MIWRPHLWRCAVRWREAYRQRSAIPRLPAARLDVGCLQHRFRTLELTTDRGWRIAEVHTRARLLADLDLLAQQLRETTTRLRADREQTLPSCRFLYEELLAVEEEFGELAVERGDVIVSTDSIVLEDVSLGRFAIRLEIKRLGEDAPYRIEALEPNPASSSTATTHPHVHDERLCAGEGRAAISAALAQGRLFDFFLIVNRIMHTYAEGAAYVDLAAWHGIPCHDCGATVDTNDSFVCDNCEESLCGDCSLSCARCGNGYCAQCLDRCARCDEPYCRSCLEDCSHCGEACCPDCLAETLCQSCTEELADETFAEPAQQTNEATTEPAL